MSKGDWKRPSCISEEEHILKDALWREKDPKKQEEIQRKLEVLRERQSS